MKNAARTILLVLIAAITVAAFCACNNTPEEEKSGVTVKADGSDLLLWDGLSVTLYDVVASDDAGDGVLFTADNRTDRDEVVRIYTEEGEVIELSAPAGETAETVLTAEGVLSGGICVGNVAYVRTPAALERAAEEGRDIVLAEDVSADELVFKAPVKLETEDRTLSAKKLGFEYPDAGVFTLTGNIKAEEIFAEAPKSKITVPKEIAPERPELVLNCLIFNNEMLKEKSVTDPDMLKEAAERGAENTTLAVEGFELSCDVTFNFPVKMVLRNVTGEGKITVATDKAGEIEVKGLSPERLSVTAPLCDLTVDDANIPEAAKLWDVKTVNGYDVREIRNSATPEGVSASLGKNKWTLRGGVLRAKIEGMLTPSSMERASLTVTAPGYSADYCDFCKNEDGTVNLLSKKGVALRLTKGDEVLIVPVETEFENILPVVEINTADGKDIDSKTDWKTATFTFDASFSDKDWDTVDSVECKVAGRGNSTWDWSFKKPYKIKLSEKASVAGLASSKNWVLLANYMDKSLIRNYVALECAKVMDNCDSYATQYPVNLFLNGEYAGVYSIGEKVEEGKGRAFIREKAYSVDTGFILELNGASDEEDKSSTFRVPHLGPVTVQYPELTLLSEKQLTFISNHMTLASRAVYQGRGWREYIDVDSLIDWYIIIELSYNSDSCLRRSVFFEKDSGGKIRMGQPWDFDLAFGNSRGDSAYDIWAALADTNYVKTNWMTYLMNDEEFYAELRARWNEKKDELLAVALDTVADGRRVVSPSAKYNFEKWDILDVQLSMEPFYAFEGNDTYEKQVNYLENFIKTRWEWIDKTLNSEKTEK